MFDCANVEMRELLPELAAGTLDAATRVRVEQHVASCAECASELETLRLVRSAYASAPAVDARRIVAALPKPTRSARGSARVAPAPKPVRRWMDWRVAAALTMITVGGLSLAVTRRWGSNVIPRDSVQALSPVGTSSAQSPIASSGKGAPPARTDTSRPIVEPRAAMPRAAEPKAQLAFAGGVEDLDDASIEALLGALEEIDRAPIAPSAEPDPTPVLPVIGTGQR